MLGVQPDYFLYSKALGRCIPQEDCTPPTGGGGVGGWCGASGPRQGSGAEPLKLKTNVNLACKSIVISTQSRPFIRRMI